MTPFNDRYEYSVLVLSEIWNEKNYLKTIYEIEKRYIKHFRNISEENISDIEWDSISYRSIKKLEQDHKHDVVATCEYLKKQLSDILEDGSDRFVHFGLTSQDVVSLAYTKMVQESYNLIVEKTVSVYGAYKDVFNKRTLMGYTHGQEAVPIDGTNLVEIMQSFLTLDRSRPKTRFGNGACGGYFSQQLSDDIKVVVAANDVLHECGMDRAISRQTNYYPYIRKVLMELYEVASYLKNESKNMWLYCMNGTLIQHNDPKQSGSSAMPQKINPIKFENAEANLTMAMSNFMMIYDKIMESRLDRDLSDLSVMRNVGLGFAYLYLGMESFIGGMEKVSLKKFELTNYSIFAEFVSMTLKTKTDIRDPYSLCKKIFKGEQMDEDEFIGSIDSLEIEEHVKEFIKKKAKDVRRRR